MPATQSTTSPNAVPTSPPRQVSLRGAFWYWLKLGFISFGGPAGQIGMMHQELVERRRWISEHRFLHALNYCMVLPGPEAQQLATYIGWLMHGVRGGLIAGVLFVLPSLLILIALTYVYLAYGHVTLVAGLLYGMKPAVTAIVVFAAYRIGSRALKNGVLWALAAGAFVAIFAFDVHFPYIVLAAAILGIIGGRLSPAHFQTGGGHAASAKAIGPALIDDHTPPPAYARFTWPRLLRLVVVGVAIWAIAMGILAYRFGIEHTLTQMGWFFSKAALLTFGGAYAVLPYVYQGAVEQYAWLTGTQMIDGLALGETTPGPLIMVVAFVGFVGAWTQSVLGPDSLLWAGVVGASVATFFTFLPSFLFIFIGAPAVEATRGDLKFTAPLTAITAAVVGVILQLAVFFAYHTLWPQGIHVGASANDIVATLEWPALAIGFAAGVALFYFKRGIIQVIVGAGIAGLIVTWAARNFV